MGRTVINVVRTCGLTHLSVLFGSNICLNNLNLPPIRKKRKKKQDLRRRKKERGKKKMKKKRNQGLMVHGTLISMKSK